MISRSWLSEDHYLVTHTVESTGFRLDQFLKTRYRKRSREALKRAIDSGAITLSRPQGPHLQVGRLKPGTQLSQGVWLIARCQTLEEAEVLGTEALLHWGWWPK